MWWPGLQELGIRDWGLGNSGERNFDLRLMHLRELIRTYEITPNRGGHVPPEVPGIESLGEGPAAAVSDRVGPECGSPGRCPRPTLEYSAGRREPGVPQPASPSGRAPKKSAPPSANSSPWRLKGVRYLFA